MEDPISALSRVHYFYSGTTHSIDFHFQVGSKEIKAHRCVLGQHSPVFRSMFNNESMIEAREGIIDIQDAKYESVRLLTSSILALLFLFLINSFLSSGEGPVENPCLGSSDGGVHVHRINGYSGFKFSRRSAGHW